MKREVFNRPVSGSHLKKVQELLLKKNIKEEKNRKEGYSLVTWLECDTSNDKAHH